MFILTAVTRNLAIARFLFGYSGQFWGMFSKIRLDIIKSFISSLPIAVACLINSNCYFCLETLLLTQWWKKNTKSRKDNSVENKPTRWRFLLEPGKDKDSTGSVTERCPYCPPFNNGHVPHKRPHKICERCSFFNLEETFFLILS